MPETSDQAAQRQRRANWVGLRTLRTRPKVVGALADGEPVYEVRSVRLLLRGQTPHFNRLVACERCGRDQAGAPVLSALDLDTPPRPMICTDCVRKAGVSSVWEPDVARAPAERPAPTAPEPKEPVPPTPAPVAVESGEGSRIDSLERGMADGLARIRAELAAEGEARGAALEDTLRRSVEGLGQHLERQRLDLAAAVTAMGTARSDLDRVDATNEELAGVQALIARRLDELAGAVDRTTAGVDALVAATEHRNRRLDALEERIDRLAGHLAVPPPEIPALDLSGDVQLLDALEQQLAGASVRLAALSGGPRTDTRTGEPEHQER